MDDKQFKDDYEYYENEEDFSPKPVFWALHTAPPVLGETASISFFLVSGKLP